ncbi:hypothetical protein A5630_25225 [Mycolicibacterium mucogenicum]|uniref:Uncharacterized protein n=1 Tax=Mycolicibacterium mucogenicum TaxID=56689 RepID=A0A1A3GWQ1_MYCMU|nr:hypothetical protein [Mycolicibacterium mucogenicum]OBJ40255.1 hypothetical protein A5630_25225 [Mycolicibacterium mucogenicum]
MIAEFFRNIAACFLLVLSVGCWGIAALGLKASTTATYWDGGDTAWLIGFVVAGIVSMAGFMTVVTYF